MSGGRFNYENDTLCREIFNWRVYADYGEEGREQSMQARRIDPLDDFVISELVFDVFCLLHSYDWWQSGDTGEDTYREDVYRFKKKWLTTISEERVREIVDDELDAVRERLYSAMGVKHDE